MDTPRPEQIRTIAVSGHSGTGKTTLCDLLLYKLQAVDKLGSPDKRNSVSDYTPEEQERLASIYTTPLAATQGGTLLQILDTPGYGEFFGETVSAFAAADNVLIVIDAAAGVEAGTVRAWKLARQLKKPTFIAINRCDRENADFYQIVQQLESIYGKNVCVPVTEPDASGSKMTRVLNLLNKDEAIPPELQAETEHFKEELIEDVAETEEVLLDHYLSGIPLSEQEFDRGIHHAILSGKLVPVFALSGLKDLGVEQLLEDMERIFIHPLYERKITFADGAEKTARADGELVVQCFKTAIDPFLGQIAYLKVLTGSLTPESELYNLTTGEKERIPFLHLPSGKQLLPISKAVPGMIVAAGKLKSASTGVTYASSNKSELRMEDLPFPKPVMSLAIAPGKAGEDEKLITAIHKYTFADPTLRHERHPETGEELLSGMGDQHLALILKKVKETAKIEVLTSAPKIPYRETITGSGDGHFRHKKQTGGHGQFAEVFLRIAPHPEGYEFANDTVGGSIPKNFISAVEKGVLEAMARGPLAGCVVEKVKVSVYDGKFHDVDSSEMAFKVAARAAFRDAMSKAKPILLEPLMTVEILTPDTYMGQITSDMNHRRGRVLGMEAEDGMQKVIVEAPLSEMSRYAAELRALTQGHGSFSMTFSRYERVPEHVAKGVIGQFKVESDEE